MKYEDIRVGEVEGKLTGSSVVAQKKNWTDHELVFNNFWSKNGGKCSVPLSNISETRETSSGSLHSNAALMVNPGSGNSLTVSLVPGTEIDPGQITVSGAQVSNGSARKPGSCDTENVASSRPIKRSESFRAADVSIKIPYDPNGSDVASYEASPGNIIQIPRNFHGSARLKPAPCPEGRKRRSSWNGI